jgi:alpha-L-rhamnosidase
MRTIAIQFIFFFLGAITSVTAAAQPCIKSAWEAVWIGEDVPSLPNTFQRYRHTFTLTEVPAKALASIATDSKYWLWINGKLVVFEGQLKRGPTPADTYYDEVDLKPFLLTGRNTVAVLVWYWGKDGFSHKSSGKAGLLFEANLAGQTIKSDASWKVARHPSFQNSQPPLPNFRLPEHNIRYDARMGNEDWIKTSFDDGQWSTATVLSKAGGAPWNALWKRPIPLWYDSGLIAFKNSIVNNEGTVRMKLPANITVTPYLKIEAPEGLLIDIRTDNYGGGSAPNVRTEYITRNGVQEFESPAYFNGHEVVYTIPNGVTVLDLKYRETKYNTQYVGYYKSSDPFFETLWNKAATTLNVNMRDGISDCPDRERAQWWGDIVINLEEIFYTCDERGLPAIQKAISNLLEWQKADGVLFSPVPAGNWDKELPAQMLASIGKYGIWKYIEYSGDTGMIRYAYPFIKKYMVLWQLGDNGLVKHRAGGWDWHDWGDKIDVPLLDNAWYYMALESSYHMASHLGLREEAENYRRQMQRIKLAFQKQFWKGNRFASEGYPFFADDRGNGLAVCAGLVSGEQWRMLKPLLDTTFHAGPYLEKYVLESYFVMNDAAGGLKRMKKRYENMVNHPAITTLWEGWEIGSATFGGGTYNHGWTGGPLSLLSGYAAGIRPTRLGYQSYEIKPQRGGLTELSAHTLTAKGYASVQLIASLKRMEMIVETLPASGVIALPKMGRKYRRITVNGKKSDRYFRRSGEDDQYVYFNCNRTGKYTIVAE